MKIKKTTASLAIGLMFLGLSSAQAGTIFTESFNQVSGGGYHNGLQYQSGLNLGYGTNLAAWTESGQSTAHVVDTNTSPSVTNYAVMFYRDNVIQLSSPIAGSNTLGQLYSVSFDASAAVYAGGSQRTLANDGLVVQVRQGNSVLSSYTYTPGAWTGNMAFSNTQFQYTGTGTGDITLRVGTVFPTADRFGGAIDNITVAAVPEPETYAMFLAGLGIMGVIARRRKQQ